MANSGHKLRLHPLSSGHPKAISIAGASQGLDVATIVAAFGSGFKVCTSNHRGCSLRGLPLLGSSTTTAGKSGGSHRPDGERAAERPVKGEIAAIAVWEIQAKQLTVDREAPMSHKDFEALAWTAANAKARELGWIV